MQTFMPFATTDFRKSAEVLDNKRLNKQALEGWQIMLTLLKLDPEGNHREPKGWVNHPAVKLWKGHEELLYYYVLCMVAEWKDRGYTSTIGNKATATLTAAHNAGKLSLSSLPPRWVIHTDKFEKIASSHRTALLAKDYAWYSQFNWTEDKGVTPTQYDYVWS